MGWGREDDVERVLHDQVRRVVGEDAMEREAMRRGEIRRKRRRGGRRRRYAVDCLDDHEILPPLFQMFELFLHFDCLGDLRGVGSCSPTPRDPKFMRWHLQNLFDTK